MSELSGVNSSVSGANIASRPSVAGLPSVGSFDSDLPRFWLCPAVPTDKDRAMSNTAPEIIECEGVNDGLVILGRNPLTGVKDGLLSRETLSLEVKCNPDEESADYKKGFVLVRPLKHPNKCMKNGEGLFSSATDEWELGDGDEFSLYLDKYR